MKRLTRRLPPTDPGRALWQARLTLQRDGEPSTIWAAFIDVAYWQ